MIIGTESLDKRFGAVHALDAVTLRIEEGATGLLGPNGSGKTTLLRILLGLLPAEGSATVLGLDPTREPLAVRARIGYMPESECIIPGLPGVDVVAYLGRLSGMARRPAFKRAHEVMYYVGLEEERYRQATEYSQGMQQRLKLATALVHDPEADLPRRADQRARSTGRARRHAAEIVRSSRQRARQEPSSSVAPARRRERVCRHVVMLQKQGCVVEKGEIEHLTNDHTGEPTRCGLGADPRATRRPSSSAAQRAGAEVRAADAEPMPPSSCPPRTRARGSVRGGARAADVQHDRRMKPTRDSLEDVFLAHMEDGDPEAIAEAG